MMKSLEGEVMQNLINTDLIYILLIAFSALICVLIISFIFLRRQKYYFKAKSDLLEKVLSNLEPFDRLETNLESILEFIGTMIPASTYSFYILDEKNHQFVLKSVRIKTDQDAKVGPSYSGLIPYKKEVFHPPINIPYENTDIETGLTYSGEVPLLNISIGKKAIVRVGPIKSLSKLHQKWMKSFSVILEKPIEILIEANYYKSKTQVLETSEKAIQYISNVTMDPLTMVQMIFESSFNAFGMKAGLFLIKEGTSFQVPFYQGMPPSLLEKIREDQELPVFLNHLEKKPSFIVIKEKEDYETLPSILKREKQPMYMFFRILIGSKVGYFIFWMNDDDIHNQNNMTNLESIKYTFQKLETYLKFQSHTNSSKQIHLEKLKMLAQFVDNLTPYTIGYSDLMSRYSIILAKELKLPEEQVVNIGLAAYLSNIGIVGLTDSLVHKEGQYTEFEFEEMKIHAEVGAAIIENSLANKELAAYIRHHHERVDGNGYPHGLRGDEIPIGARVIGVVQTFLAKINGRAYRSPLTFENALLELKNSVGNQLDEKIVDAFIQWFHKKQENPLLKGKSLGKCWEMCCVPASICMNCPAYGKHDSNCWELETNNCAAHGKSCSTCFVYTETLARASKNPTFKRRETKVGSY